MEKKFKITDKLSELVWMLEMIFWKYVPAIILNEKQQRAKKILKKVYWYKHIDDYVDSNIDNKKLEKTLKILLQYYDERKNNDILKK